jgi:hypothetical protein
MTNAGPCRVADPYTLLEQYLSGDSSPLHSSGVDRLLAPKKCEVCGASVFEDSRNGLSQYCQRHGYIIARVQDLMEERDPMEGEARVILAQAEAEANKLFAVMADDDPQLNGLASASRESHARSLDPSHTRLRQELKDERQPRRNVVRINKGTVGTVLAILAVGVVMPLLGLNLFLSSQGSRTLELWPLPGFLGGVGLWQGTQAELFLVPIIALLLVVVGIGWVLIEKDDGRREN